MIGIIDDKATKYIVQMEKIFRESLILILNYKKWLEF